MAARRSERSFSQHTTPLEKKKKPLRIMKMLTSEMYQQHKLRDRVYSIKIHQLAPTSFYKNSYYTGDSMFIYRNGRGLSYDLGYEAYLFNIKNKN